MSESPTPRVQPFYCPYCGESDFVPFGDEAGRFYCESCRRHFWLRFVGLGAAVTGGEDRG